MALRRHLSLKVRLAALTGCSTILVLSVGAVLLYRNLEGEISAAITDELRVRVSDVAAVYAEGRDDAGANSPVVAQVIDQSGVVLSPRGQESLLQPTQLASAIAGEQVSDQRVDAIGDDARVLARVADTRRGRVVVVAATSTSSLAAARSRLLVVLTIAGPSFAVAITALAWLLADAALRPVRRITQEAESISLAVPGRRVPQPNGHDELAELGRTLNQMLARIEETVARERMFIDDASHELRTPLAVLRGELELAAQRPDDVDEVRTGLASALEETDRLAHLAEDLLTLARADAGQVVVGQDEIELSAVVGTLVDRLPTADHVRVEVRGDRAVVQADVRTIEQIVGNLLTNAVRHARARVELTLRNDDRTVTISVSDDGPGFPPELLAHAFERFTRADTSRGRSGTGLGLAIVSSLAGALGGSASASNGPPLGGAHVVVRLPAARAATASDPAATTPADLAVSRAPGPAPSRGR